MSTVERSSVELAQLFARTRARLVFRDRLVPPIFLLKDGFRDLALDVLVVKDDAYDFATANLKPKYLGNDPTSDFNYNAEAILNDIQSIMDDAVPLNCLHVPVVTLRAEKYVEHIGSYPVYVDDVGFDLLIPLIAACHDIPTFPLKNRWLGHRSVSGERLYVGLLHIYLLFHLASQSEQGHRTAAALYWNGRAVENFLTPLSGRAFR